MAKHKKQKPIKQYFIDSITDAVGTPQKSIKTGDNEYWAEKPVSVHEFFEKFLREPAFPLQDEFNQAMVGKDAFGFTEEYYEGHAFWGKGSGKDSDISKLLVYICYKLKCLYKPQKFLREKYGCSIGDNEPIDIANMSINARQAQNVFFKKFKSYIKNCINPETGKNWFQEKGVDIREGYDIQTNEVKISETISAHSLNSETHTGEGLNIFMATIDEFGAFPAQGAFNLHDAIGQTVVSRFKMVGKVMVFSYKYKNNDPMDTLYKLGLKDKKVFSSKHATYEVNLAIKKKDLAKFYRKNPEKAKRTFECGGDEETGGYVSKKYMLKKMFDPVFENPIKGNLISVKSNYLQTLEFKPWFRGTSGRIYAFRADLGTGRKEMGYDCAGFTLLHAEKMYPKVDPKLRRELAKENILIELTDNELNITRKGYVIDLYMQIVADKGTEIQFADIRKFVIRLKEQFGFNIVFGSYDKWQSKDSIQILQTHGFDVRELSVDRDNESYDLWKELMYQQLVKGYPNDIAEREAKELEVNDKGKIDHPEKSFARMETEGVDYGSKDVMDTVAGAIADAQERIPLEVDLFFA